MKKILLTDEIVFDCKPDAVPYNYRISYKIAQVCLIMSKCCTSRGSCSLVKLHILSNFLNSNEKMNEMLKYLREENSYLIVRFDSSINGAIKYAMADNLIVQLKNGKYKLTETGKKFINYINEDETLMSREKKMLDKVGYQLTNEKIESLMSFWRYKNAKN